MLPNYVAYILDDQLKLVPVDTPGELVIGGAGVSVGYLHNPDLTPRHFVPNPYGTPEDVARGWATMYRTGDLCRLRNDGALLSDSRIAGDTQIKIRGIRIEFAGIESTMVRESNGVLSEAMVTLRGTDPEFLVAHVVFSPSHDILSKTASCISFFHIFLCHNT
jgi:hybrid polyketide synthase/nonribosomal peptide synthetase ACE1